MYTTELLDEARKFMHHMLTKVVEYGGSDLLLQLISRPVSNSKG